MCGFLSSLLKKRMYLRVTSGSIFIQLLSRIKCFLYCFNLFSTIPMRVFKGCSVFVSQILMYSGTFCGSGPTRLNLCLKFWHFHLFILCWISNRLLDLKTCLAGTTNICKSELSTICHYISACFWFTASRSWCFIVQALRQPNSSYLLNSSLRLTQKMVVCYGFFLPTMYSISSHDISHIQALRASIK